MSTINQLVRKPRVKVVAYAPVFTQLARKNLTQLCVRFAVSV